MNEAVMLALIAIIAAVIPALFKLLAANTKALQALATSNDERTKVEKENSDKQIAILERTANEAEQRNGHLGEQNIQIVKLVTNQNKDVTEIKHSNKRIADTLSKSALIAAEDRDALLFPEQHIDTQVVEHQTVKKKE